MIECSFKPKTNKNKNTKPKVPKEVLSGGEEEDSQSGNYIGL